MELELAIAAEDDAQVIKNLWPLYQYDLSTVGGTLPNAFGVFEDDPIRVLEIDEPLSYWFRRPGFLFPYLIFVDGRAAGMAFVGAANRGSAPQQPQEPAGTDGTSPSAGYVLHEFFVLRPFRGKGIGRQVMAELISRHPGDWEMWVLPDNISALSFWRKVLAALDVTHVQEHREFQKDWGSDAVVIRFRVGE